MTRENRRIRLHVRMCEVVLVNEAKVDANGNDPQ